MAAPVEQLTMYYEDSVNLYTKAQTPFNKRTAPISSGATAIGFPSSLPLRLGTKSTRSTAGDLYYFHNEASDVAGYKKLLIEPSDIAKQSISKSMSAGDPPTTQLCGAWITDPGVPGHVGLTPSGTWNTQLRQRRTVDGLNYSSSWTVRWYRYYYDTEVSSWLESGQIAFTIGGQATNSETTQTYTHSVIPVTFGLTDRLIAKIWANLEETGDLS